MNTFIIEFESRDKILFVTSWTEVMTSKPLFQNTFVLRRPACSNQFCLHHKNLIKTTIKDSIKLS